MNDLTSALEQARRRADGAGGRGVMATAARRCALMLALVMLFLAVVVGGPPSPETGKGGPLPPVLAERGLAPQIVVKGASAETFADADQQGTDESGWYDGTISTRARFKTH